MRVASSQGDTAIPPFLSLSNILTCFGPNVLIDIIVKR